MRFCGQQENSLGGNNACQIQISWRNAPRQSSEKAEWLLAVSISVSLIRENFSDH